MDEKRYNDVQFNDAPLTEEEIKDGWVFCPDCDYLLTKEEDCCYKMTIL